MSLALITGGAGFIGSHLAEALLARGRRVHVIDNLSTGSMGNIDPLRDHPNFGYTVGDAGDRALMAEWVDRADEIYHLAAAVGVKLVVTQPVETIETNIHPTELLLDLANTKKKKVFLASTSEVYGKNDRMPLSEDSDMLLGPTTKGRWAYACSKAIDEFLALSYHRQHGLPVVIGRFFNVVGPRQVGHYGMVVPRFVDQALAGGPIQVYDDGQMVRCFAHVRDVIAGVLGLMACADAEGQVFNIGSDEALTIEALAQAVRQRVDPAIAIVHVPYSQAYTEGFEDIRRRVPDLRKVQGLIGYACRHRLDEILDELIGLRGGGRPEPGRGRNGA